MARMLDILQVNTIDVGGGAERMCQLFHQGFRDLGHNASVAVGRQYDPASDTTVIDPGANPPRRSLPVRILRRLFAPCLDNVARNRRIDSVLPNGPYWKKLLNKHRGHEDFDFPGTWKLLDLLPRRPDIVHCHNLHGEYFDLRFLPTLSTRVPTVLTLHDAWLLSGHCAHSFDCERWKIGCGQCPYLSANPAIRADGTAYNWARKRDIYAQSRLYVATPSRWLMDKVTQSMLMPAIIEPRVIANGVDRSIFQPADKRAARRHLDLPLDANILMFVATQSRSNSFKDYRMLEQAVKQLSMRNLSRPLLFLALGDTGRQRRLGKAELRCVPFQKSPKLVAKYYQAADVYIHAARADTFPNVVLEALACGTPVAATAVGGIPEQVRDLHACGADQPTGVLVPAGDVQALVDELDYLLRSPATLEVMSANAALDAKTRFDIKDTVRQYVDWFEQITQALALKIAG